MKREEQGATQNRYQVIPRTLIFITKDDQILLLKGSVNKKLWAGQYNGIGGHIEKGEDVYQSALRELHEETGLQNIALTLRGSIMIDVAATTGISLFVFSGEYQSGEILDSEEGALEWLPIDSLEEYPLVEDLYELIPRVLSPHNGFVFGHYFFEAGTFKMAFQA